MGLLVSIGIPVTDGIDGLSLKIDSIIDQSHRDFEVIIVDDTGDDISRAVRVDEAERYNDVIYAKAPGH